MSTGNAQYNAEAFIAQGSTRLENYGHSLYGESHYEQRYASTYTVTASTIPLQFSVLRSSTNVTWNLAAAKQGASFKLCILDATSSGIHTLQCTTDYTIVTGAGSGLTATIQNPGLVEVYCPSTLLYVIGGVVAGSSDLAGTGSS